MERPGSEGSRAVCPLLQQDAEGLLCLWQEQEMDRKMGRRQRDWPAPTHMQKLSGLNLFCSTKSNLYTVWKPLSSLQCLGVKQCATQNKGQVLAATASPFPEMSSWWHGLMLSAPSFPFTAQRRTENQLLLWIPCPNKSHSPGAIPLSSLRHPGSFPRCKLCGDSMRLAALGHSLLCLVFCS